MSNKIDIYLQKALPEQYLKPSKESGEAPVKDIEALCQLYHNKYDSFGAVTFYIYDPIDMIPFIKALNALFQAQGIDTKVDARLLKDKIHAFTPMIVVDGDIVSRGVYPDLGVMRGGNNSINRGGSGHHH